MPMPAAAIGARDWLDGEGEGVEVGVVVVVVVVVGEVADEEVEEDGTAERG
jgi:hypothetical protein